MKITYIFLTIVFVAVLLVSCEKSATALNPEPLIGSWVEDEWDTSELELKKSNKLQKDKYGFTILPDGKFVENKNSGWCATPPISYKEFEGTWQQITHDSLAIEVDFWGGTQNFKIKILALSNETMKVSYHY